MKHWSMLRDLARFPAKWNLFAEKESRQINMLEHVLVAKPLRTLAGHALGVLCRIHLPA